MNVLSLTPAAVNKVQTLIEDEGDDSLCLRVFVTGGGCSGFQYGFTFDTEVAEDDAQVEQEGVKVLVDSLSYPYLDGASLDYKESLEGSRFVVTNPQASATCGCGSSFTI
ncbi:iron-sulfur cluster insertion protein ErpA [Bermanella sp. WJH001]|uniref:iron-sulfur cluster insertion protein ErpA n=1 Tax=Bermanella sp. WJH001 TaxID=3048005 RepID=UPI0024BECAAD|nr:iron-sulfur cluster insertion protein ErpA [Bermanella sp. WJH001]MDJ1539341.1 iron-sulfur cluster insertion protein ErpA [Bermanella sp. WJH001]